jgi:sulfatase modifying factor 1
MKKIIVIGILFVFFSSCGDYYSGELTGVPGRKKYFEPVPFGIEFITQGSYNAGPSDQDVPFAQNNFSKTVTVEPFWMDQTEITNNEYRQYIRWVKDSLIRELVGDVLPDEFRIIVDAYDQPLEPDIFGREHIINWEQKLDKRIIEENAEVRDAINNLYYDMEDRFFGKREINVHKLNYRYFWIDLQQAAKRSNAFQNEFKENLDDLDEDPGAYQGNIIMPDGTVQPIENRGAFILKDVVNVYPDTLCWIRDFTYSYNEPIATSYFWHPSYDNYPIVGITWKQATAFCIWRTQLLNHALTASGDFPVQNYRLPLESEWEYAARGDHDNCMYPWGGIYTRNREGCFLANFKPLRGNYAPDGGVTTVAVGMYEPNEYGLYDMAGNVAEWCANSYDESAYFFYHDLNPDYKYNATDKDDPVMKRKVIRGGSWKDIAYYLQVSTRTYEYQDTATSYVGFRCVRSYLGNN